MKERHGLCGALPHLRARGRPNLFLMRTNESRAQEALRELVIGGQHVVERVVHSEPGVVAHKGGSRGSQGTCVGMGASRACYCHVCVCACVLQ